MSMAHRGSRGRRRLRGTAWLGLLLMGLAGPGLAQPACDPSLDGSEAGVPHCYYSITVRDADTGAPIPCVQLTTTHSVAYTSDQNGVVAFFEPGLMGQPVHFTPNRVGWNPPVDGLGWEGAVLLPREGNGGVIGMTADPAVPPEACNAGDRESRLVADYVPDPSLRFEIRVVDAETGRGVPLIEVRSPEETYVTDSNGVVAYFDPDRMGESVFFEVTGHGYAEIPAGGVDLVVTEGGSAVVPLARVNVAERLYRVTGAGVYRDSAMLGLATPLQQPLLNGRVMGQDTVRMTPYKGFLFWIWGDTNKPSHPLGNFHASGAYSAIPGQGGLDPAVGIDLNYFVDSSGFAKPMAPIPGPGATWILALVDVLDSSGEEQLIAHYGKTQVLGEPLEQGIARYSEASGEFERVLAFSPGDGVLPVGFTHKLTHDGVEYVYYQNGIRVPATAEALLDPTTYETYTALVEGSSSLLDRDAEGRLRYGWRRDTPALEESLVGNGITPGEALFGHLRDPHTGEAIIAQQSGSIAWNEHRQRFVRIVLQLWGESSLLGEVWYAEGDTPMGPWVYARKIVTHDDYSLYNPRQHPLFDQDGGRTIFFEGTYSALFSGAPTKTPRYDYNHVMYRLDLDDERLALPVPVYDVSTSGAPARLVTLRGVRPDMEDPPLAFFAMDRPAPGMIPFRAVLLGCASQRLVADGDPRFETVFYAFPPDAPDAPAQTVPLYEYRRTSAKRYHYSVDPDLSIEGYVRDEPIARVWPNPLEVTLPVTDYLPPLVADAGSDYRCVSGVHPITLDASNSSHASGTIAHYDWRWVQGGSTVSVSGMTPEVELPIGQHHVTLTVTDEAGRVRSAGQAISVKSASKCGLGFEVAPLLVLLLRRRARRAKPL